MRAKLRNGPKFCVAHSKSTTKGKKASSYKYGSQDSRYYHERSCLEEKERIQARPPDAQSPRYLGNVALETAPLLSLNCEVEQWLKTFRF